MPSSTKTTKTELGELLQICADQAEENGEFMMAQELSEFARQVGNQVQRWTAEGVALALGFNKPMTLIGRRSGRTTRMLCQAVSDAANGLTVVCRGNSGRGLRGGHVHQAQELLERLRSVTSIAVDGAIVASDDRFSVEQISAIYVDHYQARGYY